MILRDILEAPRPRALLLARNCSRAAATNISRELAAESYAHRYRDTRRGAELGELAILSARRSGDSGILATALIYAGNAFRLVCRYHSSNQALVEAAGLPLDAQQQERLVSFQASLALDLRDWPTFLHFCLKGLARANTRPDRARFLVKLSIARGYLGELNAAISAAAEAVELSDADSPEARSLLRQATQTLCWWLQEAGYPERALELISAAQQAFAVESDPLETPKLTWVEGRVYYKLNARVVGLRLLAQARDWFLAYRQPADAVMIQVDMAYLEALSGNSQRSLELCRECLPFLEMAGLKRDSAAVRLLMRAARRGEPLDFREASEAIEMACKRARSRRPAA